MLRTFLALTLESAARERLVRVGREVCAALGPESAHLRPTRPEQLHLTIAFLGDTQQEQVAEVTAVVERVGQRHAPFCLHADQFLYLPKPKRVQAVALGLADVQGCAEALARDLASGLARVGFEFEQRRFLAHVTLFRSRKPFRYRPEFPVDVGPTVGQIAVTLGRISYYASFLEASGARHELLSTAALGAPTS